MDRPEHVRAVLFDTGGTDIGGLLFELRSHGIACALVSSMPSHALLHELGRSRMLARFDAVIGTDMITRHKPDPEGCLLAARLLDVDPASCVVIAAADAGIAAARAAGMYVCARDDGSGTLDLSHADETFSSYAELMFR